MYCSNCGQPRNANLNYCNSCGTRVERASGTEPVPQSRALGLCAAGVIGVVGIGFLAPLLRLLLESRLEQAALLLIVVAYLLTLLSMFSVMIVFVWKDRGEKVSPGRTSEDYAAPPSLRRADTAQLAEPHQQPASVTDHTTRTLDHVPVRGR